MSGTMYNTRYPDTHSVVVKNCNLLALHTLCTVKLNNAFFPLHSHIHRTRPRGVFLLLLLYLLVVCAIK